METPVKKLQVFLFFLLVGSNCAFAQSVFLQHDLSAEDMEYASAVVRQALVDKGHEILDSSSLQSFRIMFDMTPGLGDEAYAIERDGMSLHIRGGDRGGLIYGAFSLAEQIRNGVALNEVKAQQESPLLPFRAIKFNLPWDSYRSSSALDLHHDTVRDTAYWEKFLDMMAENRFNALTLWNLHPFPYMIAPRNFPEASPFSPEELAEWQDFYRTIFRMARLRGIDTYLVNWNILVNKQFAEAHNLEGNNYFPYYKGRADIQGDAQTSELVKRYTRESVTQVLEEYPDLTGFGFSFGEQMGGMTPAERQSWMEDTIIAGMRDARRPVKMIFRAPFSADLGQGGSTDKATEELTREAIAKLGNDFDGPIWMEIKFNWSHAHSTPQLVKVHGGELKDTYFHPVPENYRVAWMIRNEDFYALRWGSPDFIRTHLAHNATQNYVGGYFVGSENYIPAVDYFTAIDETVDWTYAFERQWLFYSLWGRLLYNPQTPDSVFTAAFVRRYGETAAPLLEAYELASNTALRFASSIDFTWDFTLYSEGMMVLTRNGVEPVSVDRLIIQPPLHPGWLSVKDFVTRMSAGEPLAPHTVTPLTLAELMETDARKALKLVEAITTEGRPSLRYEVADVKAWAGLGLYYAEKLRGAVALQRYRTQGHEDDKQMAVAHLEKSLAHWDEVIAITRPLYRDMPLAHYNPPDNQRNDDNLFHWARVRHHIAADVETGKNASFEGPGMQERE